jgi:hypothetical protein
LKGKDQIRSDELKSPRKVRAFRHEQQKLTPIVFPYSATVLYCVLFTCIAKRPTRAELEHELRTKQVNPQQQHEQAVKQVTAIWQNRDNWDWRASRDFNETARGTMNTATHPLYIAANQRYHPELNANAAIHTGTGTERAGKSSISSTAQAPSQRQIENQKSIALTKKLQLKRGHNEASTAAVSVAASEPPYQPGDQIPLKPLAE